MSGEPVSVAQAGRPWGWALAFLWMPALVYGLAATLPPNDYAWISLPIGSVVLASGARQVTRANTFPLRRLWFWLNTVTCALWTLVTALLLFLMALRAVGFRFAP